MTSQWNDPVARERMISHNSDTLARARNNPEVIKKKIEGLKKANSARLKSQWSDSNYRTKMSRKMKDQHSDPKGVLSKSIMSNSGKKRYKLNYKGYKLSMRSTWEVKFATWLIDSNIEFEYETCTFKYILGRSAKNILS